jgi:hypothetical protein
VVAARIEVTEPPANSGQALLTVDYVDNFAKDKDSWQYLPGQRRVRKSPSVATTRRTPRPPASPTSTTSTCSMAKATATT